MGAEEQVAVDMVRRLFHGVVEERREKHKWVGVT